MYNEEVMDHFKNPRNQGVIKDADGIGQVGNPVCLLPQEKIFVNGLYKEIKSVKKGESVTTHRSNCKRITQRVGRKFIGQAITLQNCLGKISLTPEHLVFAIKLPNHSKFFRTKNKQKLTPSWYHAEDLIERDIVLYPLPKQAKNVAFIKANISKRRYDFKSKSIPVKVPLSADFLRLAGYYMAEGNIQDRSSKTYISFTLNIKETDIVDDIKNISKKLFGIEARVTLKPNKKTANVYLYNVYLARWFKELFGNGAGNKYFPEFIMNLPSDKQKYLLKALWQCDGYININRQGPRASYATISYQLGQQVKDLLLRQGIIPSIYVNKARTVKGVNHKKSYRIHVGQRDSLVRLCEILGVKYNPKSYPAVKSWIDGDYLYTPITKVKKNDFNGRVYNLEIKDDHSFISGAFCLHNCGDMMKIYIKVGKNKKGEEIINDIKFETLGCGAAIATSSMLTEMVKGQKIEEALKIEKLDIAKKLGGLPEPKLHCSVLAHDGFKKAVKNYKSKILNNAKF